MKFKQTTRVVLLTLVVVLPLVATGQSVKRQCVSSYCTIISDNGVALEQTAGQPFNTTAAYEQTVLVLPGFQQSLVLKNGAADGEIQNDLILSVYPNPACCLVTINAQEEIKEPVITLYDLNGRVVWMEKPDSFVSYTLELERWPKGIYILKLTDMNHFGYSTKLIINK